MPFRRGSPPQQPHKGPTAEQVQLNLGFSRLRPSRSGARGQGQQLALSPAGPDGGASPEIQEKWFGGVAGTPKRNPWKTPWDIRLGVCSSFMEVTGNDDPGDRVCINTRTPAP